MQHPEPGRERRRLRELPAVALVPSAITVLALIAGLTSIRFALEGQWRLAVFAIIVAALCDGMDGKLARLLNSTSRFGAELDSLADFLSFGVAPALLLHQWALRDAGGLGWAAVLVFATCAALRLARFNSEIDPPVPAPQWKRNFFVGVPAPAGGMLALLLLFVTLAGGGEVFRSGPLNAVWLIAIAFLMISRIPTFSVKKARLPMTAVLPTLIGVVLVAAALISYPWQALVLLSVAYLVSIPVSMRAARRFEKASAD
jgi:CDP-diacylglycerol---serine O-phosphatidyltransferase